MNGFLIIFGLVAIPVVVTLISWLPRASDGDWGSWWPFGSGGDSSCDGGDGGGD